VYYIGYLVTLEKPGIVPKMDRPRAGPHEVLQVFTNSTVRICRGVIEETLLLFMVTVKK